MRDVWINWRWREEPEAPRSWQHPERSVVVVDGLLEEPATLADPARMAANDALVAYLRHAVVVFIESPKTLARPMAPFGPRRIPALRAERQVDLDGDAVRALCAVKAEHRALVISPREELALAPRINPIDFSWLEGWARIINGHGVKPDLVVVCGPVGPDAWPMHPAWARQIKAQCDEAGVAFAFMGWGSWCPVSQLPPGSYASPAATVAEVDGGGFAVRHDTGPAGAAASGRRLDGEEYLALPEGL